MGSDMSEQARRRNRLFDMEFDEVSTVDKPANDRGLIAIAKSAEDAMAGEDQQVIDLPDDLVLEHGQEYVDEDGNAYTFVETDENGEPKPLEGIDELDLEGAYEVFAEDGEQGEQPGDGGGDGGDDGVEKGLVGMLPRSAAVQLSRGRRATRGAIQNAGGRIKGAGEWAQKNPWKAGGIAAGTTAGLGGGYMVARKSAGEEVLEALSKAVTDADRDAVIAKMAERTDQAEQYAAEVAKALEEERDLRITEAFIAKAAEYELPVDPEVFGPILKACAEVLDDDQLAVLDAVLVSKADLYNEIGVAGGALPAGIHDEVLAASGTLVTKAAGGMSVEQASVALYDANPDAYEAYLAEQMGR